MTTGLKMFAAAAVAIGGMAAGAARADQPIRWQYSAGASYAEGDFGEPQRTEIFSTPLAVKATRGRWAIRVSTAFLTVRGPASGVIIGDGGVVGPGGGTATRSGIGDTTITAIYSLSRIRHSHAYLDLRARVRLPTGSESKGLGVGATDYGLDAEIGEDWKPGGVYASFGRRFLGDNSSFVRRDGWQASVGGWLNQGRKVQLGAYFDWRQNAIAGFPDAQELGVYASYRLKRELKIQFSAGAGMSKASPDFSTGVMLIYRPQMRHHSR